MKKSFLLLAVVCVLCFVFAQDDDWIYRVHYNQTENCPDSNTCFTEVLVDLRMAVIPDSFYLSLNFGTAAGADSEMNSG